MGSWAKRADGVFTIAWEDYQATHTDFKGIWTRHDEVSHADLVGRRTLMVYDQGTCLVIEGRGLVITDAPRAFRILEEMQAGSWRLEVMNDQGEWETASAGLTQDAAKSCARALRGRTPAA